MSDRPMYRPVYKALHRPLTSWGVDRRLFFLSLLLGAATFNLFYSLLAGLLMFGGRYAFALWATARPRDAADFTRIIEGAPTIRPRHARSPRDRGQVMVKLGRIRCDYREAGSVNGLFQAIRRASISALVALLLLPAVAFAQQSPWERAANNLAITFTGPLARSLALVSIVIGGLMFMFGEGGAKRQISGIVFGGGLALFAGQFLTWLF